MLTVTYNHYCYYYYHLHHCRQVAPEHLVEGKALKCGISQPTKKAEPYICVTCSAS